MILNIDILCLVLILYILCQGYTYFIIAVQYNALYRGHAQAQLIDESLNLNCFFGDMLKGNILGFGY